MNKSRHAVSVLVAATCLTLMGAPRLVVAQEPSATAAPLAVNACHVSPIVENLDRSARFYRELGLEVNLPDGNPPLEWDTDPGHLNIHGVPQAKVRFTQGRMPKVQCGVEIVEFGGIDRKPVQRAVQDPGASMLIVRVRDLDKAFNRIAQIKAPIVTAGGAPIVVGPGNTRAVVLKDPDGHLIEMIQSDPAPAVSVAGSSNVTELGLRVTVSSLDRTLGLFQRRLGLPLTAAAAFVKNHAMTALVGLLDVESRVSSVDIPLRPSPANPPGVSLHLELVEYKGGPAPARHASRIQDPGSYRLMLGMRDLDAAIDTIKATGAPIVSTGGKAVSMQFGRTLWRIAAMPEEDNLFLIVMQGPLPLQSSR